MKDNILEIDKSEPLVKVRDKRGRRMGVDRRIYSYSLHFPERRAGKDRRTGKERRKFPRLKNKY